MRRRIATSLLALAVLAGATTIARAQDLPPAPEDPTAPGGPLDQNLDYRGDDVVPGASEQTDNDLTPYAKDDARGWEQIAGARFPGGGDEGTEPVDGSFTSFADDLFTVSFQSTDRGFAGGSTCLDPPDREDFSTAEEYGQEVKDCERGPVIYGYTDPVNADAEWKRVTVEDDDEPGYVGAIAWISPSKAVAVGGTGAYPRREAKRGLEESYEDWIAKDPAGRGRAWIYDPANEGDHDWHEIDLEEQNAPCVQPTDPNCGMRGMTALDFKQGAKNEPGFAGALGQLWQWDGSSQTFTNRLDRASPQAEMTGAQSFDYRVRAIRFVIGEEAVRAFAVTAGCCGTSPAESGSRILEYQRDRRPGPWLLSVPIAETIDDQPPIKVDETEIGSVPTFGDGEVVLVDPPIHVLDETEIYDPPAVSLGEGGRTVNRVSPDRVTPDSFYSLSVSAAGTFSAGAGVALSAVASPGGPERDGEQPSMVTARQCSASSDAYTWNFSRASLSTARLVSGDGDTNAAFFLGSTDGYNKLGGRPSTGNRPKDCDQGLGGKTIGDGLPDWVMGELRSTRKPGLGARALAYTTASQSLAPGTLNIRPGFEDKEHLGDGPEKQPQITESPTTYEATDQQKLDAYRRSLYFLLPSYSLNAIDMVGETGVGWTVGDHGAVLGFGKADAGGRGSEPEPPALRPRPGDKLPSAAYAGHQPAVPPGAAGLVPALASQATEHLDRPELFGAGFADPTREPPGSYGTPRQEAVKQIVMSRDGSEGWAIGSTQWSTPNHQLTLFHYRGGTWTRCDPTGISGLLSADRACAGVEPLVEWFNSKGTAFNVRLVAAARVPLENDTDPSNDDEFEVIAAGTHYAATPTSTPRPAIIHYRDGRWTVQDEAVREALQVPIGTSVEGVAFTAPDDGWILSPSASTTVNHHKLFHFDGERWTDCSTGDLCGDDERRAVFHPRAESPLTGTTLTGTTRVEADKVKGIQAVGDRIYLYGARVGPDGRQYPMILWRERGESEWHGSSDGSDGSYDPGFDADGDGVPDGGATVSGWVDSLALTDDGDGNPAGWAVGSFGAPGAVYTDVDNFPSIAPPATVLSRLDASGDWQPFPDAGALHDYLFPSIQGKSTWGPLPEIQATLPPGEDADGYALIGQVHKGRIFEFDPATQRWGLLRDARRHQTFNGDIQGDVRAIAPDGQGGAWIAIRNGKQGNTTKAFRQEFGHDYFFHYTTRPAKPVFEEVPNPFADSSARLTSLQGSPNGSLWAGTSDGTLYRYDRLTGWVRTRVPGWDPGRVVTRTTGINAVAVGPSGEGVAVGDGGRIADLLPAEARLDRVAGTELCASSESAPCSTGWDLLAAAIAPDDGSALVGGESAALLWRPGADGDFRVVSSPPGSAGIEITGLSMADAGHAFLTTNRGSVYAGSLAGNDWTWRLENLGPESQLLTENSPGTALALNSIAIGPPPVYHGYAVGEKGIILERSGSGERPWRRLDTPYLDDLTSVTLGAGGQALIGGAGGVIMTAEGETVELARPADYSGYRLSGETLDPSVFPAPPTPVVGVALMPGRESGQTEAWAAISGHATSTGTDRLLHYSSAPDDPLLDPATRAEPLPDAPPPREGELTLAAFGKSDCTAPANDLARDICLEAQGTMMLNEVIMRRITDEVASDDRGAPDLALYTGDAVDTAGLPAQPVTAPTATGGMESDWFTRPSSRDLHGPLKLRRFAELYTQPLVEAGVPLFGAVGGQDLSEVSNCVDVLTAGCPGTRSAGVSAGDNLAWRQAFAGMPQPWGSGEDADRDLVIEPVRTDGSVRVSDVSTVDDPTGFGYDTEAKLDGASTHYAADVSRTGSDSPVARVIVLDSSLGSPTSSDPTQQPIELQGQLDWLDRMTCFRDQAAGCTREPEQAAIVVSNAPTYSYGPGALSETDTSAALVEQHLISGKVNLLVSGKLGWNGLYYICAPQLHTPRPEGTYPESAPSELADCVAEQDTSRLPVEPPDSNELLDDVVGTGIVPAVIASSAGGKFNQQAERAGSATATNGYWRGYTIVRLDPTGDHRDIVVEQRPILDWIRLLGETHELRAKKSIQLKGIGRQPFGVVRLNVGEDNIHSGGLRAIARQLEISSAAITHRYDLLYANPTMPGLAATDDSPPSGVSADGPDSCGPYICLDSKVGTIHGQSGLVKAGNGNYPETFAIAQLSVGEMAATYPLVFEPRASFKPPVPPPPRPASLPPPPANPTQPPQPQPPAVDPLVPPVLPSLTAAPPPAPPVPPTPPPAESQAPLDLNLSPNALNATPPTAVTQPPTPPVNPAPPGGARREARQRQAAAQKSGADADEGSEVQDAGGDLADSPRAPEGAQMTRHDFTALAHRDQPSAWARDALIGGGIGLAALILAFGFRTARPTPRRREPELPAPAFSRARRR